MKSSQNIHRLGHTKFTSCSSDFVLKTLERASDLKMLISFPFLFVCHFWWAKRKIDTCIFCLATSCVDLSSLCNIRYPAEWTGVNVPVVFRMKIKISKSRLSLLISGIICLNLLKNKIFKIKIWSLASENTCKI
jgi:hypothetical protein